MQLKTPGKARVLTYLRTADRDSETAESLLSHAPHLHESIGFSSQQAVLVFYGFSAPFAHDLMSLSSGLAATTAFDTADVTAATVLTGFAVNWRYDFDDAPIYTSAGLVAMAYRFRDKIRP